MLFFHIFFSFSVVSCGWTPTVSNADASRPSGTYGDVVTYTCSTGYILAGGSTGKRKCSTAGTWDVAGGYPDPVCTSWSACDVCACSFVRSFVCTFTYTKCSQTPSYRRQNNRHADCGPLNERTRRRRLQKDGCIYFRPHIPPPSTAMSDLHPKYRQRFCTSSNTLITWL